MSFGAYCFKMFRHVKVKLLIEHWRLRNVVIFRRPISVFELNVNRGHERLKGTDIRPNYNCLHAQARPTQSKSIKFKPDTRVPGCTVPNTQFKKFIHAQDTPPSRADRR